MARISLLADQHRRLPEVARLAREANGDGMLTQWAAARRWSLGGVTLMQRLRDFYDADEGRRGDELHFGVGWRTPRYDLFEFSLFWIRDTRELCALRAPVREVGPRGPFSNPIAPVPFYSNVQQQREEDLRVEVVAKLDEAELDTALRGWQDHLDEPAGFDWVLSAVAAWSPDS